MCCAKLSTASWTSIDANDQATVATLTLAAALDFLRFVKGVNMGDLIDSGSSESFIHPDLAEYHALIVHYLSGAVFMVSTSFSVQTI